MIKQICTYPDGRTETTHYHGVPFEALLASRIAKHDPFQKRHYAVSFNIVLPVR